MWPSIAKIWPAHCDRFEGCLGFMYLDTLGLVTTGRGNLIDPIEAALPLPWLNKATKTIVGADAISAEWRRVKAAQDLAPRGGGAFASMTVLFLSQPSIDALTARKLASNESTLASGPLSPVWIGLCADAQLACHSMAWALGAGFPGKYPKWTAAMLAGDWAGAAAECAISHPVNASILARNALNVRGFVWAATVANAGLDPSICWSMQE